MPMPLWWGQINKRIFNKRAVAGGKWPVLTHVGRRSGVSHRTPLDAHPIEGGYLFVLVYGSRADWVRNILAAGSARLAADGRELDLVSPTVVGRDQAERLLPPDVARPPKMLRITEFLRMELATRPAAAAGDS